MDGWKASGGVSKSCLKRQLAEAEKQGFRMKTGVECEYHLINDDGTDIADEKDPTE